MILGPADASVDPSEKDEDKEIAMRSKIIAYRLVTAPLVLKLEVSDDADRMERNLICDWFLLVLAGGVEYKL